MCLIDAKPIPIRKYTCYKIVKRYEYKPTGLVRYMTQIMNSNIPLDAISGENLYKAEGLQRVIDTGVGTEVHGGFIHSYMRLRDALACLYEDKVYYRNGEEFSARIQLELWECRIEPCEHGLSYVYRGRTTYPAFASESVRFVKRIAYASDGVLKFVRDDEIKEAVRLEYMDDGSDFMHSMLKLAGGREPSFLGELRIKLKRYIRNRKTNKNK
jgi:hypothetical protein